MGICKIIKASASLVGTTTNPCGSSMAWGGIGEEGRFELLVLRDTVSEEQWKRRFARDRFMMEEAFEVPAALFGQTHEIKAGSYPVEATGNYLHICF